MTLTTLIIPIILVLTGIIALVLKLTNRFSLKNILIGFGIACVVSIAAFIIVVSIVFQNY